MQALKASEIISDTPKWQGVFGSLTDKDQGAYEILILETTKR